MSISQAHDFAAVRSTKAMSLDQRREHLREKTHTIVNRATNERRDFTDAENDEVQGYLAELRQVEGQIKAADEHAALLNRLGALPEGHVTQLLDSRAGFTDAYKSLHAAVKAGTSLGVDVARKDIVAVPLPPGSGPVIGGDYPGAQPTILSLFRQEPATMPVMRAYRVSTPATAGQVAEGVAKPDAGLTLEPLDVTMIKIANTLKVSDEASQDFPTFVNAIGTELASAVRTAENTYAVGVINAASGLLVGTNASIVDGVADAVATLAATVGVTATSVVTTPALLAAARKAKAETSGTYVFDPLTAAPTTLHGLQVITSTAVPVDTAYIGGFETGGVTFTREQLRVETGMAENDFIANMKRLRAEERVALALVRPSHLYKLTVGAVI